MAPPASAKSPKPVKLKQLETLEADCLQSHDFAACDSAKKAINQRVHSRQYEKDGLTREDHARRQFEIMVKLCLDGRRSYDCHYGAKYARNGSFYFSSGSVGFDPGGVNIDEMFALGCELGEALSCLETKQYDRACKLGNIHGCTLNNPEARAKAEQRAAEREQSLAVAEKAAQDCEQGNAGACHDAYAVLIKSSNADVRERAAQLGMKGCDLGHGGSCSALAELVRKRNFALAVNYWSKGCDAAHAESCVMGGEALQTTQINIANKTMRAAEFMHKACQFGRSEACPPEPEPVVQASFPPFPDYLCRDGQSRQACAETHVATHNSIHADRYAKARALEFFSWYCLNPDTRSGEYCMRTSQALENQNRDDRSTLRSAIIFAELSCDYGYSWGCLRVSALQERLKNWRYPDETGGGFGQFLSDLGKGLAMANRMAAENSAASAPQYDVVIGSGSTALTDAAQDWRNFSNAVRATNNIGTGYNSNCPASNPYC